MYVCMFMHTLLWDIPTVVFCIIANLVAHVDTNAHFLCNVCSMFVCAWTMHVLMYVHMYVYA